MKNKLFILITTFLMLSCIFIVGCNNSNSIKSNIVSDESDTNKTDNNNQKSDEKYKIEIFRELDGDVTYEYIDVEWEKINADIAAEGESADMLTPRSLVNWAKQTKVIGNPIEACEYNILAALCSSEEYKQNVLNNIIRPLFGRRG